MSVFKTMTIAAGLVVAAFSAAPAYAGASTGTWKYSPQEIRHQQMRQRYESRGYYQGRHYGAQRGRHHGWDRRDRY